MTGNDKASLRMTLESYWAAEGDDYQPMLGEVERFVASAIRAAENEALERAASAIDEKIAACSYGVADCVLCQARAQVARLVRSLKHPEGK